VRSRAAVALVAVAVLAWLGMMERAAHLQERGLAAAGRLDVAGNLARADASLRAARRLNPDTGPDLGRALLYLGSDRRREAVALLEGVLEREPANVSAWRALYAATRETDRTTARRALAELARLDPINARRR
jgi:predicted Zn-dependent protease